MAETAPNADLRLTISVLTERETSELLRLAAALSRHRLYVESYSCAEGEVTSTYQHTIVVRAPMERVRRAIRQVSAGVGVLKVEYHHG